MDLLDIQDLIFDFGNGPGSDANGDGQTNLDDLQIVLFYFGTAC